MEDQLNLFPKLPSSLKIPRVIKRDGKLVEFQREKITQAIYKAAVSVGGQDMKTAETLTEKVLEYMHKLFQPGSAPSVEEVQDLIEKVLIEKGHAKTAKAFILYRAERARLREKKEAIIEVQDNIPYKLIWKIYSWNVDHECDSVEKINRRMRDGTWKKLVEDSEKHYHHEIKKVAQAIGKRKDDLRLMIVAGPSSSGKTTTTMKIGEALRESGISFVMMSLDNYFKNAESHPVDEFGDRDFESPNALDLELINEHLSALLKGKTIKMPYYDFKSGVRTDNVTEFKLKKGEIILIDSLHGLYADMTKSIPVEQKFKFYIEAICQIKDLNGEFIRWTDLRILRRMVRDSWHRGYEPEQTIGHWHYVRRGEKKYIVPFIHSVDYVFNGSLGYEMPVYKSLLEPLFPKILKTYENNPKRLDAFIRAQRISRLLGSLEAFPDAEAIPRNSCIREFIGGSVYKY